MNREKNIDILKAIGSLAIILAHVEPNKIIFQIRNFDVILMIMVSAYLYMKKDNRKTKYVYKRIKRLLIPTWIFLTIFFAISFFIKPYNLKTIISTYILHDGIGYVWIIRIYLITAVILTILVPKLQDKHTYIYIGVVYLMYELLAQLGIFEKNIILKDIVAYIAPIMLIVGVTYWIKKSNNKKVVIFSFANLIIYLINLIAIYLITGEVHDTNYMKYPFRIYYLSYAFFVSSMLIIINRNEKIVELFYNKFIKFISQSSLWIYLWHILFVVYINYYFPDLIWELKYIVVLSAAIFTTYIQNKIIDKINCDNEITKLFRG